LAQSTRPPTRLPATRNILEFITSPISVPFIVGVTRQDQPRVWSPEDVAAYFGLPEGQVIGLNAIDPTDGRRALTRLLERSLNAFPAHRP